MLLMTLSFSGQEGVTVKGSGSANLEASSDVLQQSSCENAHLRILSLSIVRPVLPISVNRCYLNCRVFQECWNSGFLFIHCSGDFGHRKFSHASSIRIFPQLAPILLMSAFSILPELRKSG